MIICSKDVSENTYVLSVQMSCDIRSLWVSLITQTVIGLRLLLWVIEINNDNLTFELSASFLLLQRRNKNAWLTSIITVLEVFCWVVTAIRLFMPPHFTTHISNKLTKCWKIYWSEYYVSLSKHINIDEHHTWYQ